MPNDKAPQGAAAAKKPARINAKLRDIQSRLHCPKDQKSEEGWSFRSAEDIIRNVRPLLQEHGLLLRFQEWPTTVGGWNYIVCVVYLVDDEGNSVSTQTAIREHPAEVNRSASQITGSCISYAHKAVLSDLFALDNSAAGDDMEDPDRRIHYVYQEKAPNEVPPQEAHEDVRPILNEASGDWAREVAAIRSSEETAERIQGRILRAYRITEKDYRKLLALAGKAPAAEKNP